MSSMQVAESSSHILSAPSKTSLTAQSPGFDDVDSPKVQSKPCVHCGLPMTVPASTPESQVVFCCNGCKGAYELIHGWGLNEFYAIRDQMTISGPALSAGTQSNYERFDQHEYLGQSAPQQTSDDLVCAELGIHGLHCAACSWLIERALSNQPGMYAARVKLSDHTLKVTFDPEQAKLSGIAKLLDSLGYQLLPLDRARDSHLRLENRRMLVQIAIAGFLAANAMWIAVALYAGQFSGLATEHKYFFELIGMALGATAVFGPGRTFLRGAIASLRTKTPHMDLPIALALFVGAVVGTWNAIRGAGDVYFDGLASLVFLLLIGRWIQFRQQYHAAQSVDLMLRVTPRHANLIDSSGDSVLIAVDRLNIGDRIRVEAGECAPADGIVESGYSALDRSLLTGESLPVSIRPGDAIEAGTINTGSPVTVQVTAIGKNSRIGKVMQAVESASTEKTPLVQLADRIGGVFIVVVLILAAITFAIWLPRSFDQAVSFGTAMLIVACPCALAMATPLAVAVGIGRAAKAQILIRDGAALQHLSKPGIIWLDKTGTLTEGRQLARLVWGDRQSVCLASILERQCKHPIAQAIATLGSEITCTKNNEFPPADHELKLLPGGIRGVVTGHTITVGNSALIKSLSIPLTDELSNLSLKLAANGETPIFIAVNEEVAAILGLSDPVRPQASQLIFAATEMNWDIGILSGDLPEIVGHVAHQVGISKNLCHGGVSPENKLATIRQSRSHYPTVVMIGDGANDAAALAAADVGIAVRGGAEVSLHAAPVYLASNQLINIARLLKGSKTTMRVIYFNFAVSLTYNLIAVGLALSGLISPLIAAIIMPLSSITVLGLTFLIPTFSGSHNIENPVEVTR